MESLNIVDLVIIFIMFVFTISGFARGFLASLLQLFSSVASLALAVWLAKPVAVLINGVVDMTGWFAIKISEILASADPIFESVVGNISGFDPTAALTAQNLKDIIDGTQLSVIFKTAIKSFIPDNASVAVGQSIGAWFGDLLGAIVSLVAAALLIYIAIKIAVSILSKIFDAITKNAAIGGLDRLLGLAFGALKGALVIAVVFALYSVIVIVPGVEAVTSGLLESSTIGKPIYNYVSEFIVGQIGNIDFNAIIQGLFS